MILSHIFSFLERARSHSNTLFDIVYINLETRPDRKVHMEKLLNYADCSFSRQDAVNGKMLMNRKTELSDYTKGVPFQPDLEQYWNIDRNLFGMAGCKFSHQIVWQHIIEQNKNWPTLILEDDLDIDIDFVRKIENAIKTQADDWEVILLSRCYRRRADAHVNQRNSLVRVGFFYECLSYIVRNAEVAKKMQKITLNDPAERPVDIVLGNASARSDIIVYAFDRFIACQRRDMFNSDIPSSDQMAIVRLENSLTEAVRHLK